jgi:hypothetical protein
MSTSSIQDYLASIKSWNRYQNAFQHFWDLLPDNKKDNLTQLSLDHVADTLIQLHKKSVSQARSAYSAALIISGFDQLKFCSLLQPFKKEWNKNVEKYATFWSPIDLLNQLAASPVDPSDTAALRDRLILCCRLLMLHRSIDLSRVKRTVSTVGTSHFVLIQRKGWKQHKWERIISLPHLQGISPWHLLLQYVAITSHLMLPGGPLILALHTPFRPLTSNSIASLTKKLLQSYGINSSIWTAHSTRGAGVFLYKALGLSGEEVCELGKWKNSQAFSNHYLRLGSFNRAEALLTSTFVHNSSLEASAGDDLSSTPGKKCFDQGGRDKEDTAEAESEPTQPTQDNRQSAKRPRDDHDSHPPRFSFATPLSGAAPKRPRRQTKQ